MQYKIPRLVDMVPGLEYTEHGYAFRPAPNPNEGKSIYLAGPMTGYPNFNFDAFHDAANQLRNEGWKVWNPAEKDEEDGVVDGAGWAEGDDQKLVASGWDFKKAFLWDVTKVIESDGIYMLRGWQKSTGARAEHSVALAIQARYPEYKIIYG